jgi:hypothetical protein
MGSSSGLLLSSSPGPWLQGQSLQDVTIALMPAMLPREGQTFEDPSVPIFPSLLENEAR